MEDDPWGEDFTDAAPGISSDDGMGSQKEFDLIKKNTRRYAEKDFQLPEGLGDVSAQPK